MPFHSLSLLARRTTNKSQRYLNPWARNLPVSNSLVSFLRRESYSSQRIFADRGSSRVVKRMSNSSSRPYCRTTSARSGWLKTLPKVRNTTSIVPYPSHSTCPGWEKEKDKILAKCHKNTYNYCDEGHRKEMGDCVKGMAGKTMVSVVDWLLCLFASVLLNLRLQLKYGSTAMSYCPIADKKLENYEKDDKSQAMKFFTQYCATKGKKC